MGEKATRYIQSLKRINAEKAKKERDEFLISHNFKTTIKDENGREKTIAETVTDEEYEILREAVFVDPDPKAKEDKASAGWFPILIGGLTAIVGVALFFYCISNVSAVIAWGALISCVVLPSVLFALGEIVNGIRQIELTSNINEKTLKEILRYVKASNCSKGTSQEDENHDSCSVESAEEATPSQKTSVDCEGSSLYTEKEKLESKNQPNQDPFEENQAKSTDKSNKIVATVICVAVVLIAIIIVWGATQGAY